MTRQPMGLLVKASSLLLIGAGVLHASQQTDFYDVIIRNGTVFDGTGAPGKRGDVGIRGGYIAAVGDLTKRVARVEIDAAGLYIAPGFINVHDPLETDALPTARKTCCSKESRRRF